MSFEPGTPFTFVHANGTRNEYLIETAEASDALSSYVSLRNVDTDKLAWASKKWLRDGPRSSLGHWERP